MYRLAATHLNMFRTPQVPYLVGSCDLWNGGINKLK